jgi:hypothetical protein
MSPLSSNDNLVAVESSDLEDNQVEYANHLHKMTQGYQASSIAQEQRGQVQEELEKYG